MLISVIVPIYYGQRYIPDILKMLERNLIYAAFAFDIEPIFINDSPDEFICEDGLETYKAINPIFIVNEENMGIHYSRVRGLREARGEYILFLDQDDRIEDNYFESQLRHIGEKDIVVANGIVQYPTFDKVLYRFWSMQWTVKSIWFYAKFNSRIISPGQCLIRSNRIPTIWKERILKKNGADDYFLWLIMLTQKCRFAINREILYTHMYTSINASANFEEMNASVKELLKNAEGAVRLQYIRQIHKRICRANNNGEKILLVRLIERVNRKG